MVTDGEPEIAAGGGLPSHWDPANPRDLETIRSAMKRYPRRFRTMDESAQAEVVEMARLSAKCARDAAAAAVDPSEVIDAGRLAALSATVGAGLVKIQQTDDHHQDDLQVAQDNAKSNALNALANVNKTYLGLDPGKV